MELEQASLLVLTTKLKRNGWVCGWVGRWVGEHFVSPLWSVNLGPIPRRASSLVGSGDLGSLLSRAAPLPPSTLQSVMLCILPHRLAVGP